MKRKVLTQTVTMISLIEREMLVKRGAQMMIKVSKTAHLKIIRNSFGLSQMPIRLIRKDGANLVPISEIDTLRRPVSES